MVEAEKRKRAGWRKLVDLLAAGGADESSCLWYSSRLGGVPHQAVGGQGVAEEEGSVMTNTRARHKLPSGMHTAVYWDAAATISYVRDALLVLTMTRVGLRPTDHTGK